MNNKEHSEKHRAAQEQPAILAAKSAGRISSFRRGATGMQNLQVLCHYSAANSGADESLQIQNKLTPIVPFGLSGVTLVLASVTGWIC